MAVRGAVAESQRPSRPLAFIAGASVFARVFLCAEVVRTFLSGVSDHTQVQDFALNPLTSAYFLWKKHNEPPLL